MARPITVDERGLHLTGSPDGPFDVFFDAQHVWSFTPNGRSDVPWPHSMRQRLDGTALVEVRQGEEECFSERLQFGSGTEPIRFVDNRGIPIMIDKWGLIQRPFSGRGSEVVEQMVDVADQMIEVCARECGVHAWAAFGTLLGAAREGKVIGHDSDIDLAYLSTKTSVVELNREMYDLARALRRAGMTVLNKNGSFITVTFKAPDGATGSIDLYSCFYLSGLLHESATVRADVPRSAIEPLTEIGFEGRMLPSPADPDAMLTVSYGPDWRVPDPSFAHRPPPSTTRRFDGWFGSVMKNRRDWERFHRNTPDRAVDRPTDFGRWVRSRLDPGVHLVDIGAGTGRDLLFLAREGWSGIGLDYARGCFQRASHSAREEELPVRFSATNLYDHRDGLTMAAQVVHRTHKRRVVLAAGLLDSLEPGARRTFFSMQRLLVGHGGTSYLEFATDLGDWKGGPTQGGRRYAVPVDEVIRGCAASGGRVVANERVPSAGPRAMARTRLVVEWEKVGR